MEERDGNWRVNWARSRIFVCSCTWWVPTDGLCSVVAPFGASLLLDRTTVLNVISLEFSETPLAQYVRSPDIVRKLDWIDLFWPRDRKRAKVYPQVLHPPQHVDDHTHTRTHTHTLVHTRTHSYTLVHTRTHSYTRTHTSTYTHTHIHMLLRTEGAHSRTLPCKRVPRSLFRSPVHAARAFVKTVGV